MSGLINPDTILDGDDPLPIAIDGLHPLAATDGQVSRMNRPQREKRLDLLLEDAWDIYDRTIWQYVTSKGLDAPYRFGLFSGGNDSTTLVHMFKDEVTHAAHAHTTIGIEATRQYVRDTCEVWGLPLIERKPPNEKDHYRSLVLRRGYSKPKDGKPGKPLGGFPGPAMHFLYWNRLKSRALEQVRREFVTHSRRERVVYIAGRRQAESKRRAKIPANGPQGAILWVSPLLRWTKFDLMTYRLRMRDVDPVPANQVSDTLHLSGECLCACYIKPGEREQVEYWYPLALAEVRELEEILRGPGYEHIPEYRKTYGWSAIPELAAQADPEELIHEAGGTCESCIDRALPFAQEGAA